MSKERARLRSERAAAAERARVKRERRRLRAERRRELLRRLVPRLPDRRTGRLFARRTPAQRAAIGTGVLVALVMIWLYGGTYSTKIALSLLTLAATPVLVVVTLDRRI